MLTTLNILSPDQGKGLALRRFGDPDRDPAEEGPAAGTARRQGVAPAGRRRALAVFAAVLALPFTTTRRRASP